MSTTTTVTIPEGYRKDAHGRLVPVESIKPIDLTRDALVAEIVARATTVNAALRDLRIRTHDDIQAFAELSAERYLVKLGGKKGNITLMSFDGRYKVVRAINERLAFDERLQAAKELIDECITEWAAGAGSELRTLINDAFQVDKEGQINTGRVLSLRRMDIKDARWQRAMEAISDSLQVATSRTYLRIYERVEGTDNYLPINLDLANA